MKQSMTALGAAFLLMLGTIALPATASAKTADASAHKHTADAPPKAATSVTHGSVKIGGHSIGYTATAGTIILKNDDGKPTGSMFYVAYTKRGADASKRPVTFIYNGGPGSASLWLHMGAFGPVRVVSGDAVHSKPAPYQMVNNEYSLLDTSDLVFIDAMGTGFSKIIGKDHGGVGKPKDFYGVDADGKAFAQFIYDYLSHNDRWNSPKYLMGESYGTTRSAVLSDDLTEKGIDLNGVVLMSSILNFETASFNSGNDLPYITYLPSYAAAACYHKVVNCPADLPAYLDSVRAFAKGEYASALMQGSTLPASQRSDVLHKLARYTGLSKRYLDRANLRVNLFQFMAQLQRSRGKVTGRLDSRYSGAMRDLLGEYAFNDPQSDAITGPYTAAFNRYVRHTLKFGKDKHYEVISGKVNQHWKWKHKTPGAFSWPGFTDVTPDLAAAMRANPHMKVEVENGYYDLATPFYATEYTINHMNLPANLRSNIALKFYDCGHMLYQHLPSLKKLHANLEQFYRKTDNLSGH